MTSILWHTLRMKKRTAKTSASERVLNTYELLENILLRLSPVDLRKARLASKTWCEVIARSQTLNLAWRWQGGRKVLRQFSLLLVGEGSIGKYSLLREVR